MRIAVAMSGGVDSSVAAALLAEEGHDVIGLSMQLYDASGETGGERSFGTCCTLEDLYDARRVAAAINIPHYILNLERQFDERVVTNFVREYASRAHSPSVRSLQQRFEVCDLARAGAGLWGRRRRHWSLREGDMRRGHRKVRTPARHRPGEGPIVFPVFVDAAAIGARRLPSRGSREV